MGRPMVRDAAHEAADRGRPKIAAPHHEAERDRVYIKLTGVRVSESESSVRATLNLNGNDGRSLPLYRPLCGRKLLHRDARSGLEQRIAQHNTGVFDGYTAKRRPVVLVFSQWFEQITDAIAAERQVKGWSRAKKEALIRGDFDQLRLLAKRRH